MRPSSGGLLQWTGFPQGINNRLACSLELLKGISGSGISQAIGIWVDKWQTRWMEVYRAHAGYEPSVLDPL